MAHRTELNSRIATLSGISRHTIDRIGVNLNRSGLLVAGGRGRHAPDMGPEDLKNILLAMLGSESTGQVFETVLNLHALKDNAGRNFGDAFFEICSVPARTAEVMQVSVVRNYPQATIYWKDETGMRIGRMQDFRGVTELKPPGMRVVATIGGSILSELAGLVA